MTARPLSPPAPAATSAGDAGDAGVSGGDARVPGGDVRPILVVDSGLGGLTVARAIREAMPHENLIYFGDTARLPYGSKTPQTVTGFVRQIIRYCRPLNPKHVVLACNTASALALSALTESPDPSLPVTGVIDPGARVAVAAAGTRERPTIAVIATEATVRSKAYERAIMRRRHHARLWVLSTPLLAPMVEEGRTCDDPLVLLALRQYLQPLLERPPEVLLLGCTHYPLLMDAARQVCGPKVRVIDSAACCAEDLSRRLAKAGRLHPATNGSVAFSSMASGAMRCFVTDNSPRFRRLAGLFLGMNVGSPTTVAVDDLYDLSPMPLGEPIPSWDESLEGDAADASFAVRRPA